MTVDLYIDAHGRKRRKPSPFTPVHPELRLTWARYFETHPQGCAPVRGRDGAVRKDQPE